jgi:hypothetical protein
VVADVLGDDEVTPLELGDGLVADAEGVAVFDRDAVGDALVGGGSCVGVGDLRLGVGCGDRDAVVCGADSRVVPGVLLVAGVVRTEAVAGGPTLAGPAGVDDEVSPVRDVGRLPELSSTATIAATPQSARPIPTAARRRRRLNGEPAPRSEY